ncbi:hypothetical protein ACWCSD_32945, partial [Nonomuraea sp. NPDC001684]
MALVTNRRTASLSSPTSESGGTRQTVSPGLGGGGLPFLDYVYVNEVQGRSEYGQLALGTF